MPVSGSHFGITYNKKLMGYNVGIFGMGESRHATYYLGHWSNGASSSSVDLARVYRNYHWGNYPLGTFFLNDVQPNIQAGVVAVHDESIVSTYNYGNNGGLLSIGSAISAGWSYSSAPVTYRTITLNLPAYHNVRIWFMNGPSSHANPKYSDQTPSSGWNSGFHLLTVSSSQV